MSVYHPKLKQILGYMLQIGEKITPLTLENTYNREFDSVLKCKFSSTFDNNKFTYAFEIKIDDEVQTVRFSETNNVMILFMTTIRPVVKHFKITIGEDTEFTNQIKSWFASYPDSLFDSHSSSQYKEEIDSLFDSPSPTTKEPIPTKAQTTSDVTYPQWNKIPYIYPYSTDQLFAGSNIPPKSWEEYPVDSIGLKLSYGAVIINDRGQVLVVEPANHFSDVVWTIPKGKLDMNEIPEQTAVREAKEETGYDIELIDYIDGAWTGQTSVTRFFLARPKGEQGEWENQGTNQQETWQALFVNYECAKVLLSSSNKKSAQRDTEALEKGYEMFYKAVGGKK
jgi:ADP-ribose pyrophosphatase YjhB (NUDIX family)